MEKFPLRDRALGGEFHFFKRDRNIFDAKVELLIEMSGFN